MATTINAYSVSLGLNAAGLIDGSKLARGELSALTRDMRSLESPGEKAARAIDRVDRALASGAISVKTHGEMIQRLSTKYTQVSDAAVVAATRLDRANNALLAHAKSAAIAFASFHVVDHLRETADRIDDLANRSHQLGETVPNLQRYEFALQQMGNLDASTADQYLVKLTRSIGEASLGAKGMGDSFKRLGLDVATLAAASPVERFQQVAEAIGAIEDPTQQAAEATRIFGKSGADLLPILRAQSGELAAMMIEADQLGMTLDQIEAEKVAAANDALDVMGFQLQGIANQIVVEIAPAVQSLAGLFRSSGDELGGTVGMIGTMVNGLAATQAVGLEVRDTLYDIGVAVAALGSGDLSKIKDVFKFEKLDGFFDGMHEAEQKAARAAAGVGKGGQATGLEDFVRNQTAAIDDMSDLDEDMKLQLAHTDQLAALQKQIDLQTLSRGEVERQAALQRGLNTTQADELKAAYDKLDAIHAQTKAIEEQKRQQEGVKQEAEQLQRSLMTPVEKLADEMNRLNAMLEVEESIDQQTFDKAKDKLLGDAVKDIKIEPAANLEVGSQDAYKFFAQRDTREQEKAVRAERKMELERQITAINKVEGAVDKVAAKLQRKR